MTEPDYLPTLPGGDLPSGSRVFVVDSGGVFPYEVAISGVGLEMEASVTVRPGGTTQLSVELESEISTVWCTVGSHRAQGTDEQLVVAG